MIKIGVCGNAGGRSTARDLEMVKLARACLKNENGSQK
jgi:hypothetical protein